MTNFVIVRDPQPRILPRSLRIAWGELYMGVDVKPFFTRDYSQARIFPSHAWADSYLHDKDGRVRAGMAGCIIRAVRDAHTIHASIERKDADASAQT